MTLPGKHRRPGTPEPTYTPPTPCTAHPDGIHYYGSVSIDESECRCGQRIRSNNSGHG